MTYWMTNADENRRATQDLLDPVGPATVDAGPSPFEGAVRATVGGVAHGIDVLAAEVGDVAIPQMQVWTDPIDDALGTNATDWLEGQRQRAFDIAAASRVDPLTTGAVGEVIHGAGSVITQAIVGGLAAGPMGASLTAGAGTGADQFRQLVEAGVDEDTAGRVALGTAVSTGVGVALPLTVGGNLLGNVAWGVGSNVGLGAAGRYDTGKVLLDAGYADMAEQYKVMDGMALATDALMGAAFPVAGRLIERTREPNLTPSQRDAADVAARIVHDERDSAPGLHRTPESLNAHLQAVQKMEEEVFINDKSPAEVDLAPMVEKLDMEPRPRGEDRRAEPRPRGDRRTRQPHEILRDDFEQRARAAGLTDEGIIEALAPRPEIDSATGWNNLQGKKFLVQEVVKDAQSRVEQTGEQSHYVSLDLQNLGGLNAFFDEVYSKSDAEYRAIMTIMREELEAVGGEVFMRTGGDELSTVVSGVSGVEIQGALDRAFTRIRDYAAERGYGDIDHAKGKPVKGVNVYGGFQEIRPGMSIGKIIDAADAAMGTKKQAAIDKALAEQAGANADGNGILVAKAGDGTPGRETGRGSDGRPAEAARAADAGTGEGSQPVRAAFDPSDPAAVAKAGDISSTDEAATLQALDAVPDMTVPDPDNPGAMVSASQLMARLDNEIAMAKQDAELSAVAVACFKTFGEM